MSWPGLADTLLSYLYKEVADFKKQLDPTALRVFKTAFTAADSTERCGESSAQSRAAGKAWVAACSCGYRMQGELRAWMSVS